MCSMTALLEYLNAQWLLYCRVSIVLVEQYQQHYKEASCYKYIDMITFVRHFLLVVPFLLSVPIPSHSRFPWLLLTPSYSLTPLLVLIMPNNTILLKLPKYWLVSIFLHRKVCYYISLLYCTTTVYCMIILPCLLTNHKPAITVCNVGCVGIQVSQMWPWIHPVKL